MNIQPFLDWLHAYSTRWDEFWTIAAAVATAAAVIVALLGIQREHAATARAERRATVAETARDKERAERDSEARRSQAVLVACYVQWESRMTPPLGKYDHRFHAYMANYSNGPIFEVRVEVFLGDESVALGGSDMIPPRDKGSIETRIDEPLVRPRAVIEFRDLVGRHWRRDQNGDLIEIEGHERIIK